MNEKPILFSGEMVRAILAGNKTQTRRIVKPQPADVEHWLRGNRSNPLQGLPIFRDFDGHGWASCGKFKCRYIGEMMHAGENGILGNTNTEDKTSRKSLLWVKETHARVHGGLLQHLDPEPDNGEQWNNGWSTVYRADGEPAHWKHYGVHWKPSIFCTRNFSRITLEIVSVRVERLNEISESDAIAEGCERDAMCGPVSWYQMLWEKINGVESWKQNPWVWVVEFKTIRQPKLSD